MQMRCCATTFLFHCGHATCFISVMSLYMFIYVMLSLYTTYFLICHSISVHNEFLNEWTFLFQACGGRVGSSPTSICHVLSIFPTPLIPGGISFPPGETKIAQCSAKCEMKCETMKTSCDAATSRPMSNRDSPLSSHGEKEVLVQWSALHSSIHGVYKNQPNKLFGFQLTRSIPMRATVPYIWICLCLWYCCGYLYALNTPGNVVSPLRWVTGTIKLQVACQ